MPQTNDDQDLNRRIGDRCLARSGNNSRFHKKAHLNIRFLLFKSNHMLRTPELRGWKEIVIAFFLLINSVGPDLGLNCLQRLSVDNEKKLSCSTDLQNK